MDTERRWRLGRLVPVLYDVVVQRERAARVAARLLWGADVRPLFADFSAPEDLPPGAAVLDVPCGGGLAFRGLSPAPDRSRRRRYVAADLSPVMLGRARAEAARRGLRPAFARASVERLPFRDGAFDLCVTYNGLHCLPDPAAALVELARVLRPGGALRGSAVVTGAGVRQDLAVAVLRRRGEFGTVYSAAGLARRLEEAGLKDVRVRPSGALAYFTARRPDREARP